LAPVPLFWSSRRLIGLRSAQVLAAQMDVHLAVERPRQGRLRHQPDQTIEILSRLGLAAISPASCSARDRGEPSICQYSSSRAGYKNHPFLSADTRFLTGPGTVSKNLLVTAESCGPRAKSSSAIASERRREASKGREEINCPSSFISSQSGYFSRNTPAFEEIDCEGSISVPTDSTCLPRLSNPLPTSSTP
jgi:hypothetical protein